MVEMKKGQTLPIIGMRMLRIKLQGLIESGQGILVLLRFVIGMSFAEPLGFVLGEWGAFFCCWCHNAQRPQKGQHAFMTLVALFRHRREDCFLYICRQGRIVPSWLKGSLIEMHILKVVIRLAMERD